MSQPAPAAVVVLAAGSGTRMQSARPKVLHELGGRSMLSHVIHAARELDPSYVAVVVRAHRDQVASHALDVDPHAVIVDQDDVAGTGRAVQCALRDLDAAHGPLEGPVVVVAGDVPLLDGATLASLLDAHDAQGNVVTLLTAQVDDPTGYGRVVREAATGTVLRVVEHRDASPEERRISEVNTSTYVFDAAVLRRELGNLAPHNAQHEVYLPDVVAAAAQQGLRVGAVVVDDPLTTSGVNDRIQLAQATRELNRRILRRWMLKGVTVVDPATTWVDVDVDLARDVTLLPGVQLRGATSVAHDATIGPDCTLTDCEVGVGAHVVRTHAQLAVIGEAVSVGPFTYLRPGAVLKTKAKSGSFTEVKNATIGERSAVAHLAYVGDATVGDGTNIGGGTIVANYDGVNKHHTDVGDAVRVGANSVLIAPVTVGDGAYVAGGTTVRSDVPAGALAVSAGPTRVIEGWVAAKRPGTPAAQAAAKADADPQSSASSSDTAQ